MGAEASCFSAAQVSHCVSFAGSKWMLRAPLMEMCFFTFPRVFMKDGLKEKSDVSFMASPEGDERYGCAAQPPISDAEVSSSQIVAL